MKKITCLLAALLLTCGLSWAQTRAEVVAYTLDGTLTGGTNGYATESQITQGGITWMVTGNTTMSPWRIGGKNLDGVDRPLYSTNPLPNDVTKVLVINGTASLTVNSMTLIVSENADFSNPTSTVSGTWAESDTTTFEKPEGVNWTNMYYKLVYNVTETSGSNKFAQFVKAEFYMEEGSVSAPSITAENVSLAYDDEEGEIEYTINDPVDGGVLTAATEAEWLTIGTIGETVPFTCTVNEEGTPREGVITLTYTYNREISTKNVTITQAGNPNALDNISDITATGTYAVQGTIVAKSQRGFVVGDGTGYVYYYNPSYVQADYAIGDMVKLAGSVVVYGGVFEFNSSTTVTPANSSNYVAEDPTVLTGADMDARVASTTPAQLSTYVQYEGTLTVNDTHYNITDIEGATTAIGSISYPLNTEFTALSGKQVRVSGYYVGISSSTYYNTMIGSVEEVVSSEPYITVSPATVEVDAEEHEGTLTLTYENLEISDMTDFGIQYYDANEEELTEVPDWFEVVVAEQDPTIGEGYVVSYFMLENEGEARSGYFKVFAAGDEEFVYSNLVTINQAAYVAPVLDYATLPFEFNGGRNDIEGTDGLTYEGLGSDYNSAPKLKFDGTGDWLLLHFEGTPGELAFDIKGNSFSEGTFTVQTSEDGDEYTDFVTFTELGTTEHMTYNNLGENVRYIKWIYTEKVNGNVALGNITLDEPAAPVPSITVEFDVIEVTATGEDDYAAITYENLEINQASDFAIQFYDAEGTELTEEPDWIAAEVTTQPGEEGYFVYYVIDENEGEARTAYFKVYAFDGEVDLVYSNLVTINQAAPEIPFEGATYSLATYIESGRHYIITNGTDRAMGAQNVSNNGSQGNNRLAVEINTVEGVAQVSSPDVVEFVINGPDIDGNYFIYDASYDASFYGYLFAASSTANQLKTEEFLDANGNGLWTITFDEENNNAVITAQGTNTRNLMRYNSNNDIFSCYTGGQQDIYLFVKDEDETYEFFKDIKAYTPDANDTWYAISTPVNTNPTNVNHMLDETFDLFKFDPTAIGEEWQNYRINNFTLTPGEGYLYANSNNVTLRFTGTADELYDGDGEVTLNYYDEENEDLCWNLVGNPFGYAAYTTALDFYVMKEDGSDFEAAERDILNPFEAIFVKAQYEGDEVVFFNDGIGGGGFDDEKLNIRVSDENGKGDFARVRFGEGNNLEKFMLNPENTKIYFPVDGEEYAVVYADNMGEMPLNFSAAADGNYTLNIHPEDMEMEYLHLIDNMTGMDVDLLANPSYSFEATTNDNAARFTLVFAGLTGIEENSDNFAFFSNGNVIVSNEGNAMLQVVDMNGRIVKSENINGTTSVNVEAAPGVYMLRLVNGDNMKVQKIIVK